MRIFVATVLGAMLLVRSPRASAEEAAGSSKATHARGKPYALENTGALFLGAEFLGSLVVFATYSIAAGDPATSCGWCSTNAFDRSLRRGLVMKESRTPGTLSHLFSVGVTPAIAFAGTIIPAFSHGHGSYAVQDSIILLNTFVLVTGVTDGTKKSADRQRPAFVYRRQAETEARDLPGEEFLSFYSGDTAWAFSFASAGTTLAYLRGYPSAPYVAINSGAFAFGTGVLRIMADMHWATDVIMGATVGTLIGFGVPFLLHQRDGSAPRIAIAPSITSERVLLVAAGSF